MNENCLWMRMPCKWSQFFGLTFPCATISNCFGAIIQFKISNRTKQGIYIRFQTIPITSKVRFLSNCPGLSPYYVDYVAPNKISNALIANPMGVPCPIIPVHRSAELLDVGLVTGAVGVDDGATDEEDDMSEVVVGPGGNERVGDEDATLQNCCARFSAAESSSGQSARIQETNSDVKRGL